MDRELAKKFLQKHPCGPYAFSVADCEELDRIARGPRPPKDRSPLNLEQIKKLQLNLEEIKSFYDWDQRTNTISTSRGRIKRFHDIKERANSLLKCFDADQNTAWEEIDRGPFAPRGIFYGDEIDGITLINSLQSLCHLCDELSGMEHGRPEPGRRSDLKLHLLVRRLGREYKTFWGEGKITLSVSNGPGPSVRFMHWCVERIIGRKMEPKRIFDAYNASFETIPDYIDI